jgi:sortase A
MVNTVSEAAIEGEANPDLVGEREVVTGGPAPSALRSGPPAPGPFVLLLSIALGLSAVVVFFAAFALWFGGLQEQRSQHLLYAEFRGLLDPSSEVAPSIGGAIPSGTPVALITAPAAGIRNVMVVQGTTSGDLLKGPGHLADTPLPGQIGQSVLIGRSTTAGAPFGAITRLRSGDLIEVITGQGAFDYVVQGQLGAGDQLPTIRGNSGLLTLVTAEGHGWLGPLSPDHLVYVDAKLKGTARAVPKGLPATVPAADIQGHNDPGAWAFVLLWSLALVAGSAACWWMWSRWGIIQTWLVGAPVLFAILWALSSEAIRLLPNAY